MTACARIRKKGTRLCRFGIGERTRHDCRILPVMVTMSIAV